MLADRLRGMPTDPAGGPLFSRAALGLLDRRRFDPSARGQFEYLSGGLIWPDEFPAFGATVCRGDAFRYLIAFRASITLGEERDEFRPVWEQVVRHAPHWPGLRPERWGGPAVRRLRAALRIQEKCFAEWESKSEACSPHGEPDAAADPARM
jgi:hypothetical protein